MPALSLTEDQRALVERLAASLERDRDKATWLSGYFAGIAGAAAGAAANEAAGNGAATTTGMGGASPPPATRTVTVLYGSETGNAKELGETLAATASARGIQATAVDMGDYKPRALKDERDLLVITSTHGEGDPPQNALDFFEFLAGRKAPKLPDLRFAVLALGDSTYEQYCQAGRRLDERFAELGAQRLSDRVECDVDYEDAAGEWIESVLAMLTPAETNGVPASTNGTAPSINGTPVTAGGAAYGTGGAAYGTGGAAYGKKHPYPAAVLENIVLTGRGSSKETRHIELSLEESGLDYQPGDALGVVAKNDPALVASLLDALALSGEQAVTVKGESMPLADALTDIYEITAATPRLLELWAKVTEATELRALAEADTAAERTAFLQSHHLLDIVERFPAPGIEPDELFGGLRPLQPRLYSLASSLAAAPEEAHLTVSTVRYTLRERPRTGVASGYLAQLEDEAARVPVYVQRNEHFHLPEDDVPILMVGAGTGVAPYRAFMQEREARGASGSSWLFFGERNFRSDFLYQTEWQELLKGGALDRLDLAFSRDATPKTYVQHRLRGAGRDVYEWLEDGAWLYVCGDAAQMAPDVHTALRELVAEHGGLDHDGAEEYLAALKRDRRYRLDVY